MQSEDKDYPLQEFMKEAMERVGPFNGFEPKADHRETAAEYWSQYQSYRQVGFTKEEALAIMLAPLKAMAAEAFRWNMEHPEGGQSK